MFIEHQKQSEGLYICNLLDFTPNVYVAGIILIFFLAAPHGMWDLSSPTRDRTCALCSGSMES